MRKKKAKISQVDATPTPRDREIQKYLLAPIGRHRGLFAGWEKIPWLNDLIRQKEKEISSECGQCVHLQSQEIRSLQREVKQYKEDGILYREIEDGFAVGFGFRTYIDFHKNGKKRKPSNTPLFDEIEERQLAETLSNELVKKIKSLRLYHQGKDIVEYILAAAHHQKRCNEIVIKQQEFAELLDPHEKNPNIGQDIKEIIDSLSWIYYKIKDREGEVVAFGCFIYDLRYNKRKREFVISINPRFLGCTQAMLTGDKDDRTKSERKELFGGREGYFYASIRKIFLCNARKFNNTQRQLIDHILLNRGQIVTYESKKYKLIKFRVSPLILDKNAPIRYSGDPSMKIRKFIKDLRVSLVDGTEGYTKIEPTLESLEKFKPSQISSLFLKCYFPINLEQIWQEAIEEEASLLVLDKSKEDSPLSETSEEDITPNLIRKTRYEQKITQDGLGKILGVSKAFICQIEKGSKAIPVEIKKKISDWMRSLEGKSLEQKRPEQS